MQRAAQQHFAPLLLLNRLGVQTKTQCWQHPVEELQPEVAAELGLEDTTAPTYWFDAPERVLYERAGCVHAATTVNLD